MSITLFPLDKAALITICDFSTADAIVLCELCGAGLYADVAVVSAQEAQHYATVCPNALRDDELPAICEREGADLADGRQLVNQYIKFCEQSGGYRVWA